MGLRTAIQERIVDRVQFLLDSRPRLDYQPLPWVGARRSGRARGSEDRWRLIEPELDRLAPVTAVDVGSNVGYFSLSMAERGISVVGIESERRFLRLAGYAARAAGLDVAFLDAHLTPTTMWRVPPADLVLLLSVYHHWIRHEGAETAGAMLTALWERCGKAMFFETGETELPERFRGPDMGDDAEAWLTDHLMSLCRGADIRCLGTSRAFVPGAGDEETAPARRHLFVVERRDVG